jgi:hypothetical protein
MYPIDLTAEYGDGSRSRGLAALGITVFLKSLLAIPHLLVVYLLLFVSTWVSWIGYWVVAFTGALPDFFFEFPARSLAWQARTTGWIASLADEYPPFEWEPAGYPVELTTTERPGPRSRGLAVLGILFLKALAVIPHAIVLAFVVLGAAIANWVAFWVILFTGGFPEGIFRFVLGALRWSTRVSAWMYTLTDRYPPFRLAP